MKYRFCHFNPDGTKFASDLMLYRDAFRIAHDHCLQSKIAIYWVEREDGKVLDAFRKFYLQDHVVTGPVFEHREYSTLGHDDWKVLGF